MKPGCPRPPSLLMWIQDPSVTPSSNHDRLVQDPSGPQRYAFQHPRSPCSLPHTPLHYGGIVIRVIKLQGVTLRLAEPDRRRRPLLLQSVRAHLLLLVPLLLRRLEELSGRSVCFPNTTPGVSTLVRGGEGYSPPFQPSGCSSHQWLSDNICEGQVQGGGGSHHFPYRAVILQGPGQYLLAPAPPCPASAAGQGSACKHACFDWTLHMLGSTTSVLSANLTA